MTTINDHRSLIWASEGKAGSGKTHFALTAPGPTTLFLFDPRGDEGPIEKFPDKDVTVHRYVYNPGRLVEVARQEAAHAVVEQFQTDYEVALESARTLIIDKDDQLWTTVQAANPIDATDKRRGALNYQDINSWMRSLVYDAAHHGRNLAMLRGIKDEWKSGSPTGRTVARGMKEIPELAQVYLKHWFDMDESMFKVQIGTEEHPKCRLGNAVELLGREFAGLDFMQLGMLLYPGSSPDEWT